MAEVKRTSVRWGRLAITLCVLILAAVLGMVGALNNWYAFALGEVTTVAPVTTTAPATTRSPGIAATPAPQAPGTDPTTNASYQEGFRQGRTEGAAAGFKDGRAKGRKIGLARGHDRGFKVGKKQGYAAGYDRGYSAGYAVGYKKGHSCTTPKRFCKSLAQ
jgi:hypothetical protein